MCMHIFYELVLGFGFFFVAARNINIFGHSFILERERGKRVPHDGFNKVFLQAFEYALSQGQESCSLLARESARCLSVLVDADVNNIVTCKHPRTTSNPLGQTEFRATSILQEAPKRDDLLSEELFASSLIICEMRRRLLLMEPCPSNSCTALLGLCSFFCWEGLLEEQGSFKYWD